MRRRANGAPESAIAIVGEVKVMIPLTSLIDKDAELVYLENELEKAAFTDKEAPHAVVEQERKRQTDFAAQLAQLQAQHEKIGKL